jgi:hypothetical protein
MANQAGLRTRAREVDDAAERALDRQRCREAAAGIDAVERRGVGVGRRIRPPTAPRPTTATFMVQLLELAA